MNTPSPADRALQRPRWMAFIAISLALAVLGGTLAWSACDLRNRIRSQIVQQDGEILDAVTALQHQNDQAAGETLAPLTDPGEQFQLALKVSKLRSVLGVRLYSADGKLANAFPAYITELDLPAGDLDQLQNLQPASHFYPAASLPEQDMLAETNQTVAPLLFVTVPLRTDDQQHLAGIIEFLMDGSSIARQYASLDRSLALRFSVAFLAGGLVLVWGIGWAMRRVQTTNRLLAERTENLLQANRELALSARMSAVGTVTAHLIHGLKNPLSGLASFVSSQQAGHANDDSDWQAALSTTQRMQEMINRVVRVVQEQQTGVEYEITADELIVMLENRTRPVARTAGVWLQTSCTAAETLSNREADLILLVLENLVQNAIEATPAAKLVRVSVINSQEGLVFEVADQGLGLPAKVAANLFAPGVTSKKNGGGIGLAISKQLAQHLGATLELVNNSTAGCVFRFTMPVRKNGLPQSAGRGILDASH